MYANDDHNPYGAPPPHNQAPPYNQVPHYNSPDDHTLLKGGYAGQNQQMPSGPPPDGGICDLNCDWTNLGETGEAGELYSDCLQCEPCCGDPCTITEGCYCCK